LPATGVTGDEEAILVGLPVSSSRYVALFVECCVNLRYQ
jgi:hypothetical protein